MPSQTYVRTGFYASEANAPSKEDARACLLRALELGVTFYNTSILYGPYVNEELIGEHFACFLRRELMTLCTIRGPDQSIVLTCEDWQPL
jgi:aryl-alcohol dehydrogenase-like predicted oxidoreductase